MLDPDPIGSAEVALAVLLAAFFIFLLITYPVDFRL
jgi:hypothetical protein